MFGIRFVHGEFEFFSEITEKGIYSLRIEKILPRIYKEILINPSQIESPTIRGHIRRLIDEITSYFSYTEYTINVNIDLSGYTEREIKIYKALIGVPSGYITTYGILTKYALGNNANRYVGRTLSRNRLQIIVPCHRVVMKDLKIGGFTSPMGIKLKILLLQKEGITISNCKIEHSRIYKF